MRSETHLTATFDVGSWEERVHDVSFRVATCLVCGRVCVTGMVVWINIHSRSVCVYVCVCVTGHRSGYYQWGLWLSQPVDTCSLYFKKWTYCAMHFPTVTNSVQARWIAFLLRVWNVPGSNFDPDNDCPYWGLSQFFSVLPRKYRDNEKNWHIRLSVYTAWRHVGA
jgi:hypothetical protein